MTDLWTYLKSVSKPIVLYGMGDGADKILSRLTTLGISVSGVFVSDGFVRPKLFHGFPLMSYSDARQKFGDIIVLTAFGSSLPDVMDNIKRISKECELYAPDLPVVGEGTFDTSYYLSRKSEFDFVRSRLADKQSEIVFDNMIEYKLTGNITPLCACETPVSEAFENILRLGKDEVFVDLGAYRGDTVAEFIHYAGTYEKIYAVEPDPKTFKKLVAGVPESVECLNIAISKDDKGAVFDVRSGRNSHISDVGKTVPTNSVDGILNGDRASYIKMDVEGAELDAISGAVHTIQNFAPKLNIAAYHRVGDLVDIPRAVLSLRDDYKIYLRHFKYLPAWDTNFYFI